MAYYLQNTWKSIQRTKNEWFKLLLTILLLTISISAISQQSEPLKHHYKVAYRPQFEPYEFTNTQNKPDGFTPNLLLEIGKATGITFEFIPLTARETVVALEKSEVDLAGMLYSPERAKQFDFSNSYGHVSDAIFQQVGNKNYITLNSLTGHTIGFVENDILLDTFATRTDFTKHILSSKLDGFLHLNNGKIDAFFCDEQTGINIIAEYDIRNVKLVSGNLYPRPYVFATRKGNQQLIQLLNKQFANFHASGKLQKLNDKWLSGKISIPGWIKKHQPLLISILAIFAGIVIILLFWNWMLRRSVYEKTKSIKESESRYSTFFENMGEGVGVLDKDEIFVFVNPTAEKIFGVGKGELLGTSLNNFLHGDSFEKNKNETQKRSQGESSVYEQEIVLQDGSKKVILITATPNFVDEKFVGAFGIFRDITERKLVEEALRESEIKYRELVDNSPDAIAIYVEGKIVFVNNECVRLMAATSAEELIGKSVIEFVHPDYRALVIERMKKAVAERVIFILPLTEEKFIRLDGTEIDVEVKAMSVQLENESAVQLIVRDITERKRTEKLLEENREEFKDLFDKAPIGYHEIDTEGRIVRINETECEMLGYTAEELIGKHFWATISKGEISRKAIEDKLTGKLEALDFFEREFRKKDGTMVSVLLKDKLLKNKDGDIIGIRTTVEDITERKLTEEAIKNERLLLRTVIDNIPNTIYAKDLAGRKTLANKAELNFLNAKSEDEVLGKDDFDFYPKEIAERFLKDDQLMIQNGLPVINKERFEFDVKGKKHWLLSSKLPLYNKDNQIIGLVGITHDITQHKQAEESLENERLLLRTVIDNIPDTIFANDLSGRKTLANAAEVNILGFKSESDLLGKDDSDFYPPKLAEKFKLDDQKLLETGEPEFDREGFITDGKGEKRWVLSSKLPLRDKNNQIIGLVCIGRNITARKKMEESLRESEEHYRTLVERMPDGVYKSTHEGKFINVNPAMVQMLGYDSMEELLNIDIKTQLYFDPEDRESLVLESELEEMGIFRLKKKDGSEIWLEDHGWYSLDEHGEVLFHEGVMRDVTNRLQSEQALSDSREELKKFAAHLQNVREEERLLLANEIHDELGQILIAIKIDMGILKQKTLKIIDKDKSKDILPKFDNIFGLIDNTINTTRKIMADNRHEELHLLGFIESAKLHTSNFQDKYQINCQFENAISKLEINPQQAIALFRILQEALNNVAEHAKATAVQVQLYAKDDKLILDIKDNGVGFTEKQEINKDAYGLIGMKERAYLLDGELKITSQPGKGTSVRVEMPYQVISE